MVQDINQSSTEVLTVEGFVYEKVMKTDIKINIPQEPIFFQAFNHRVVTGLFPQFATWGDNKVWEIKIVQITSDEIFNTTVRTDARNLSETLSRFEIKNKQRKDTIIEEVVRYLRDFYTDDRISKEIFMAKYNEKISGLNEIYGK